MRRTRAEKLVNKPLKGHFAKANVAPCRNLRELRLEDCAAYSVGDEIKVDVFAAGDQGGRDRHEQGSRLHRIHPALESPHRPDGARLQVSPRRGLAERQLHAVPRVQNKKMSGHYGVDRVTIQNLSVVRVDAERNLLLVRGAVPGPNGGTLVIRDSIKA